MDAQQAIADLTEISSQIQTAIVFDDKGKVAGSTIEDAGRAEELARAAADLLEQADKIKTGDGTLNQLEAATLEGSVFVVRDGKVRIAATTAPEPTVGLVFYDLKSALRQVNLKPAAKRPVRASGPVEGATGEPGGSPGKERQPKKRTARKTTTTKKKPAAPRKKKTDAP